MFGKGRSSHVFMDAYVLAWSAILAVALFSRLIPSWFAISIAAYRLLDIVSYRLFFLLVKSQEKPWIPDVLRRSVAIVILNFTEVVMAFAILYLNTGSISSSSNQVPIDSAGVAFYYSLVTMSTVGYGDYVPANSLGRGLVISQLSTMILFLIFLLPALISIFSPSLTRIDDGSLH